MSDYIIRADFYPNGSIIPLGITDKYGSTIYIEKVVRSILVLDNPNTIQIDCIAKGKILSLKLKGTKWDVSEVTP